MRNKTGEKVQAQKSREASADRGTRGKRDHKGGAETSNKARGGRLAR